MALGNMNEKKMLPHDGAIKDAAVQVKSNAIPEGPLYRVVLALGNRNEKCFSMIMLLKTKSNNISIEPIDRVVVALGDINEKMLQHDNAIKDAV